MLEDPEQRDRETEEAGLIKGKTACNRRACQAPLNDTDGSRWWNLSTEAYYCKHCAQRINKMAGVKVLITESEKWQQDMAPFIELAVAKMTPYPYKKKS
jgi:hypothetical protein